MERRPAELLGARGHRAPAPASSPTSGTAPPSARRRRDRCSRSMPSRSTEVMQARDAARAAVGCGDRGPTASPSTPCAPTARAVDRAGRRRGRRGHPRGAARGPRRRRARRPTACASASRRRRGRTQLVGRTHPIVERPCDPPHRHGARPALSRRWPVAPASSARPVSRHARPPSCAPALRPADPDRDAGSGRPWRKRSGSLAFTGAPDEPTWLSDRRGRPRCSISSPTGNVLPEQAAAGARARRRRPRGALSQPSSAVGSNASRRPRRRARARPRCRVAARQDDGDPAAPGGHPRHLRLPARTRRPDRWSSVAAASAPRSAPRAACCPRTCSRRSRRATRRSRGSTDADYGLERGRPARRGDHPQLEPARRRLGGSRARVAAIAAEPTDPLTGPTRERFLLPLFEELGFGRLPRRPGGRDRGHVLPDQPRLASRCRSTSWASASSSTAHARASAVPLAPRPTRWCRSTSTAPTRRCGASSATGATLRLLRDSTSLTRQAYVEFDLEAIFDGRAVRRLRAAVARLPPQPVRGRAPDETAPRALDASWRPTTAPAPSTSCAAG